MNNKVLIIDIGNTATEFAVFEDGNFQELLGFFQFPNQLEEAKKVLISYKKQGLLLNDSMMFSVVPKTEELVANLVKEAFGIFPKIFDWKNYELKNKSPLIKEAIGADLLADIRQAEDAYGGSCLVVDFGTVTKLLLLDDNSCFVGLSFVPGIEMSLKAFSDGTALLPESNELNAPKDRFGLNTIESMHHGVYFSSVYYVKELFKTLKYKNPKLIITGGNARFIKDAFPEAIIDNKLTLKGMYLLYKEAQK